MRKKILVILNLSLLLIIFSGCSFLPQPSNKTELLINNVKIYSNFKLEGVANINYKQFVFRKMIFMERDEKQISLNLLDSGVLGMNPTPFASVKIDSIITATLFGKTEKLPFSNQKISEYLSTDFILENSKEISKNLEYKRDNICLKWNEKMQIIQISSPKIMIQMEYDFVGNPEKNYIYYQDELVMEIMIDKFEKTGEKK